MEIYMYYISNNQSKEQLSSYVIDSTINWKTQYLIKYKIKDTTDTDIYASYLDLHLEIDSEERSRTKLYDIEKII